MHLDFWTPNALAIRLGLSDLDSDSRTHVLAFVLALVLVFALVLAPIPTLVLVPNALHSLILIGDFILLPFS